MEENFLAQILNQAKKFIEEQKGMWDHFKWNELLAKIQEKGVSLSEEAKNRFGEVLESMKAIYHELGQTQKHELGQTQKIEEILNTIKEKSFEFVQKNRHGWDHAAWEGFLQDIENSGVELSQSTKIYLGQVLEALKKLYWVFLQSSSNSNEKN